MKTRKEIRIVDPEPRLRKVILENIKRSKRTIGKEAEFMLLQHIDGKTF